ncbi:hypothetical protein SmphiM6_39 [Sinorhizobium phage phiM6]|nr:hypothetical protein SmphiM6_39 [Sinorhizobium phage phiM6]
MDVQIANGYLQKKEFVVVVNFHTLGWTKIIEINKEVNID